jgi:transcription elongation GreA/GreB family factor
MVTSGADKAGLRAELIAQLTDALASAQRAHAAAVEGATHSEARAENPKDTRGLEQSYLARGQAQRVAELETGLAAVVALAVRRFAPADPIAVGALVWVEHAEDGAEQRLWLAPHGGGSELAGGVQVVTPSSPLGRALLGKQVGDEVELRLPGRQRTLIIVAIA